MLPRLLAFLFAVLILSVVDALYVRTEHWHRPFDLGLFAQSFALWSFFVLLAAIPASFTMRVLERFQKSEETPWPRRVLTLIGWAAAPVAVHSTLDRHTGLYANLGALKTAQPWLEVAAVAIAFVFALIVFSRVLRRVSPGIAGSITLLVLVVAIALLPRTSDRFEPVEKSAKGKPNLLLLIWDTTRSQSLDVYGYDRNTTPGLAELAERCVLYEEARSVAVYTLTSHVTMLTGVYPSHHRARLTRMKFAPHKTPSIARMLQREGYRTGAFVGTGVLKASTGVIDGFEVYDDLVDPAICDTAAWAMVHDVQMVLRKLSFQTFNNDGNPHWIQDFQRPADTALANALDWIENGDERPWFCMINMYDVHWPYLPAEYAREKWVGPYDGDMTGSMFRADHYYLRDNHDAPEGSLLTEEDKLHLTELYDAELFELDAKVKEFMGAIDFRSGNVGLVLTADHGEAFGEGGRYEHADILEPQVRIPMLVHPPNGHPREELRGKRVSFLFVQGAEGVEPLELPEVPESSDLALRDLLDELEVREDRLNALELQLEEILANELMSAEKRIAEAIHGARESLSETLPLESGR